MPAKKSQSVSRVEEYFVKNSPYDYIYAPAEKIKTVIVDNFPALGKMTALRFIEWVQHNPGGNISLPTGKTPEHFIKWVHHYLKNWNKKEITQELENYGIDPGVIPDMKSLHFIQIDEFYPINPQQHNSFYYYVNEFYIEGFGLDPKKSLLIDGSKIGLKENESLKSIWPDFMVDLSLRFRSPNSELEERQKRVVESIDQWCQEFEEKVRRIGGIGFFLGGIGPDGHIGFNVRGSDHHSTTRLTPTNYETQAAAASDLGGIEVARKRLVITIGLGTITYNPDCTAIIIAAGEAKADVVSDAIQQPKNVLYPATALHTLKNARFFLTTGAAKKLTERQYIQLTNTKTMDDEITEKIIIDLAVSRNKKILDLTKKDFQSDRSASLLLSRREESFDKLCQMVHNSIIAKIEKGSESISNARFFHTEPHHDDLMLGYLPFIVRLIRNPSNTHYFACLTSGFTSVTNHYMKNQLESLMEFIDQPHFKEMLKEGYFDPDNEIGRNRDIWQYLDGVAAKNEELKTEGIARRLLRNLIEIFEESDLSNIKNRVLELEHYFNTQYPGKKDPQYIQRLKGMGREWEAECLWGYFGWSCSNVKNLRLGFYTGDIFTEEPTMDRDVLPIYRLMEDVKPDIVSLAFDPEASGPDTHYKVLQALNEGIQMYERKNKDVQIRIWGYRNVWYRFHPSEANIFVPVSLNMFSILQNAFMNSFISQRDASFPSYEHDGPFSELAQKIQVEQYQKIKVCLGRQWFHEHPSALIRATRGLVFMKEMTMEHFYQTSRELKKALENR
ncbi:MAG: glucosamine-6-phosphate deaminase [Calditrichaeota bacterium]|nr:glucosamine-6-phosphate deaminase [Calditrichota bacterium]RQW07268.1 MAG: glucosamine-6-phosphate deaminase [Calditrichota bacterium]